MRTAVVERLIGSQLVLSCLLAAVAAAILAFAIQNAHRPVAHPGFLHGASHSRPAVNVSGPARTPKT
jgi:hypothetical protein